jgi:phosphatidylglycerol lysyltransferase
VTTSVASPVLDTTSGTRPGRVLPLITRHPVTVVLAATCIAAGLVTTLSGHGLAADAGVHDAVSYGLPAMREGRWASFLVGMFFVPDPFLYLPILALLIGVAGTYERRVGHWQTAVIVVGGQIAGALVAALLLWPFAGSGWSWAATLALEVDTGISAGGFAALGALSAVMQPIWRRRIRIAVSAYLVAMLAQAGLLWDLEHLASWLIGLAVGPALAGRRPIRPEPFHFGGRTQRTTIAFVLALLAVATFIESLWPGNGGPFHPGGEAYEAPPAGLGIIISSVIWLVCADALRRGRRVAWVIVTALMALSVIGLALDEHSSDELASGVIIGALLITLLLTARSFGVRMRQHTFRRAGRRLAAVLGVLVAYAAVGFLVLKDDFTPVATPASALAELGRRVILSDEQTLVPATSAAEWFLFSISGVWLAAWLVTIVGAIYSSQRLEPDADDDRTLRDRLRQHHSSNIAWMLTWPGTTTWTSSDGRTAIGYRIIGSVALCLGDPVGPPEDRQAALAELDRLCFRRGWIPCLFAAGATTAAIAPELRWKAVQVAEDSVVPLAELAFKGKAWQDVRTAINKAGRANIRIECTRWADAPPAIRDQVTVISGSWVSDKALPEMGFTLGGLAELDDPDVRLHVAIDEDGTVHGFTSWMPVFDGGEVIGWTLDLMRNRDGGFRQVTEYLIAESAVVLKDEGYRFISLSAAPLAKAPEHLDLDSDERVLQRLLDFLGDTLEPAYGFRSLLAFKAKFQPQFNPMYLVFPDETTLGEIGLAIVRAYLPDASPLDFARMGWEMAAPGHA